MNDAAGPANPSEAQPFHRFAAGLWHQLCVERHAGRASRLMRIKVVRRHTLLEAGNVSSDVPTNI
jgi:hypothetical protein